MKKRPLEITQNQIYIYVGNVRGNLYGPDANATTNIKLMRILISIQIQEKSKLGINEERKNYAYNFTPFQKL